MSGTLVGPGPIAGVAGVSFAASDTGSGLYSAAVTVDGVAVASTLISGNNGRCVAIDGPGVRGRPVRRPAFRLDGSVPAGGQRHAVA